MPVADFVMSKNGSEITILLEQAKYIISQDFKIEQQILVEGQYVKGLEVNPIGTMMIEKD